MKKSIIAVLSLLAASACADLIEIHVTGTADSTDWGYTQGQSYTFTWTLNDAYTGAYDTFDPDFTSWTVETVNHPLLWTNVSGDGLQGTYSRPSGDNYAPYDYMTYNSYDEFMLFAGNDSPGTSSMGLTVNGVDLRYVDAYVNIGSLDHPTSFVDPATWLSVYEGTYAQSEGSSITLSNSNYQSISFTATSVEIIPEPAAVSTTVLTALAALFIHRRFRATLPRR